MWPPALLALQKKDCVREIEDSTNIYVRLGLITIKRAVKPAQPVKHVRVVSSALVTRAPPMMGIVMQATTAQEVQNMQKIMIVFTTPHLTRKEEDVLPATHVQLVALPRFPVQLGNIVREMGFRLLVVIARQGIIVKEDLLLLYQMEAARQLESLVQLGITVRKDRQLSSVQLELTCHTQAPLLLMSAFHVTLGNTVAPLEPMQ